MIIIYSHVQEVKGNYQCAILRKLEKNLQILWKDFFTISHCMNVPQKAFIYDGKTGKNNRRWYSIKVWPLRYFYEMLFNIFSIKKYFKQNKEKITFIGIDPLNACSGILAKKLWYVKKCIYYTPDYSPQKFKNDILNKIYHSIDRFCVKNADEVWNVSSRITEIRKKMWLSGEKNIFLPNVSWLLASKKNQNITKEIFSLITSGTLKEQLEHKRLIDTIVKLVPDFPDIHLYIAGDWPLRGEIENYISEKKVNNNITLLGFLEVEEYLQYVEKCGIWLAMYSGKWWFNYYGDSTKCREFMQFGLPILTTNFHSTADEIRQEQSGIVVDDQHQKSYENEIRKIYENYEEFSENSKRLWKKYTQIYINKIKELC